MGKTYDSINQTITDFINAQQMFFVATAPLSQQGHINVSPKGLDSLRILDDHTVVYADLIGSGIETVAHLKENSRIVLMFCAFNGPPKIIRLHGQGQVITHTHPDFPELQKQFPTYTGLRAFIRIHCTRISDSCGFGVPLYEYQGQRTTLTDWANKKSADSLNQYIQNNNTTSIDNLPGMTPNP